MKLGAHQSISGGYQQALKRISNIGGNCLQIFSSSPRGWNFAKPTEDEINQFIELKKKMMIDPVYFHATYLINLADDSRIGHMSKLSLITELNLASKLNVKGSIVHLGSFKDQRSNIKYQKLKRFWKRHRRTLCLLLKTQGTERSGRPWKKFHRLLKMLIIPGSESVLTLVICFPTVIGLTTMMNL